LTTVDPFAVKNALACVDSFGNHLWVPPPHAPAYGLKPLSLNVGQRLLFTFPLPKECLKVSVSTLGARRRIKAPNLVLGELLSETLK
jgi:hypothetical protein